MTKFNPATDNGNSTFSVESGLPKRLKKITGTRFASVIGLNHWKSPFAAWCEITKTAEPPFEGNKFTEAGIAIEPKQLEYCKTIISPNVVTPEEWFGTPKKLYDHFPEQPLFGGMWDALITKSKDSRDIAAVIEAKTSSRPQDWTEGVPANYLYQGLLYAYLLGIDRLYFVVSFLQPTDYDNPQAFECNEVNTITFEIKVSEYDIEEAVKQAEWWYEHTVQNNQSPVYDEKIDKDYLAILRSHDLTAAETDSIVDIATELTSITHEIDELKARYISALEKKQKALKARLKDVMITMIGSGEDTVTSYGWKVSKGTKVKVDEGRLEADGLLEQYQMTEETYKLTQVKEK